MGTSGTYLVSDGAPAGWDVVGDIELVDAWHCYFARDLVLPDLDRVAVLSRSSPVAVATVLDSDYCQVAGAADGRILWTWSFGEPPWGGPLADDDSPDTLSISHAAEMLSSHVAEWAIRCGLAVPDAGTVAAQLDQGYVCAEEGFFQLLTAVGLSRPEPAAHPLRVEPAQPQPIIFDSPHRWTLLQLNTPADLYVHIDAVAAWLTDARQTIIEPLIDTYRPDQVRTSMDPHEQFAGPPDGLVVLSAGWSVKNRPVFGAGDDRGWARKVRQLLQRELREIELKATGLNGDGRSRLGGPGFAQVNAVLRDHLSLTAAAPLPREHPGQLCVRVLNRLLDRIPNFDVQAALENLAASAVDAIPDCTGFIEPSRPWNSIANQLEPASAVTWSTM